MYLYLLTENLKPVFAQLLDLFDKHDLLNGVPSTSKVVDFKHPEELKVSVLYITNTG